MEVLALKGAAFVGQTCFMSIIYDVYGLVKDNTINNPAVNNVLLDLDLTAELEIIESLATSLEENRKCHASPLIRIALNHVEENITLIKKELEQIKQITHDHQYKWFANWRSPSYDQNLKNLRRLKKNLDCRVTRLIEVMKIKTFSNTSK